MDGMEKTKKLALGSFGAISAPVIFARTKLAGQVAGFLAVLGFVVAGDRGVSAEAVQAGRRLGQLNLGSVARVHRALEDVLERLVGDLLVLRFERFGEGKDLVLKGLDQIAVRRCATTAVATRGARTKIAATSPAIVLLADRRQLHEGGGREAVLGDGSRRDGRAVDEHVERLAHPGIRGPEPVANDAA